MTKASKLFLIFAFIVFGLLTSAYFFELDMPLTTGNLMMAFAFMALGIMFGMVIFLPRSAFKERISV